MSSIGYAPAGRPIRSIVSDSTPMSSIPNTLARPLSIARFVLAAPCAHARATMSFTVREPLCPALPPGYPVHVAFSTLAPGEAATLWTW